MKFLHLGDLHLGKSLGDFDLIEDQEYILEQILRIAEAEAVQGVLIAGDVYDRSIPSEAAVNLLDRFLSRLSKAGISVFMISGNHDSDDRLNYGSALLSSSGIYISSVFNGALYKKTVRDEYGELDIWLLPFVKASQVRHYFPEAVINSYDDAVRVILEAAAPEPARRNILVAHQFVTGGAEDPQLGGSEGESARVVGTVEKISYRCMDVFDYAALGHIHSPQKVGREEVRYSGSPLKYSLSEVNNEKSLPIVTVGEKGSVEIRLVPLHPMRNVRHIRGPLKEIVDKNNISSPDDFIYVTLTDEDIIDEAMGTIQKQYPNTVRLDYDNSRSRAAEQVDISKIAENKSFAELIGDFYRQIYGCEMDDEEMEYMRTAAKEAGVINETD